MKSTLATYLLWSIVGWMGMHRFYCGKTGSGLLWLCTFGLCGFGWGLDFFLVPGMVKEANLMFMLMSGRGQNQTVNVTIEHPV